MKDLVANLFILSFLIAYTAVFILLLQWTVRHWWQSRRRRTNRAWHPAARVTSELPAASLSTSRRHCPAGVQSLSPLSTGPHPT